MLLWLSPSGYSVPPLSLPPPPSFHTPSARILTSFPGLVNNVLYVIILSAAQDLVGSTVPKSVVLLADVLPSFLTKLIAPYFIHHIPYSIRILIFCVLSSWGMLLVALTPDTQTGGSITTKLFGVIMASLSGGGGELSFLGLTHYYGPLSLAAWSSGTGGAGLIGAGLYVLLTSTIGLSVRTTLITSALLPSIMLVAFFIVLPLEPLQRSRASKSSAEVPSVDVSSEEVITILTPDGTPDELSDSTSALLAPGPTIAAEAYNSHNSFTRPRATSSPPMPTLSHNISRARSLFVPYMLPLLLVYIAEYTINQAVAPVLLFPLTPPNHNHTPFTSYRQFYPFYALLYQFGVFISRSSTPLLRIHHLYTPTAIQGINLLLLLVHALHPYFSFSMVCIVIFWEGLIGGAVYVNTFAEILDCVPPEDREFSLSATTVSDSAGICIAGLIGLVLEEQLCAAQVRDGRGFCRIE
jgi:battenin